MFKKNDFVKNGEVKFLLQIFTSILGSQYKERLHKQCWNNIVGRPQHFGTFWQFSILQSIPTKSYEIKEH